MPDGTDRLTEIRSILQADRKKGRRILLVSVILFIAVCLVAICFDYETYTNYGVVRWSSPWQVIQAVYYAIKMQVIGFFHGESELLNETIDTINNKHLYTTTTVNRLCVVALTAISGAILSLSGTVYQVAMRNPMALPTMLGTTAGVDLAKMWILLNVGITAFYDMSWQMYVICYAVSGAVLVIIMAAGKLAGGKHVSVVHMLLAGTIINRLIQQYTNYLRDSIDETTLMEYQEVTQRAYSVSNQIQSLVILLIVTLVIMIPILLMRYSYNAISFDDSEAKVYGVNPGAMRVYAMIAGAVLTTATMIHFGNIGTLALIVPHLCRYTFGSEFSRVVTTSAFYGAFILVVGWFVSNFMWIGDYQIPVGDIISLFVIPVLIVFSLRERHGWN